MNDAKWKLTCNILQHRRERELDQIVLLLSNTFQLCMFITLAAILFEITRRFNSFAGLA